MRSLSAWICVCSFLLLFDETLSSWNGASALSALLADGQPGSEVSGTPSEWVDCIQASDMCNQNPQCSSRYRVMRQCLVGKEKEAMLDNNRECQAALEVLLVSPLYDCRCKRGMKKELQCLQNYWTIHMGLTEGGDVDDSSPYEPVAPGRHQDAFRLASISSGMLTVAPKGFHCADAERTCNPCLDAAKACNLNGTCKRHRSAYIATCSKEDPNKGETCSKKRCHKALRLFLDRVPTEFSHRLLFCPCQTEGCAERRRQTIVPDCSYKEKEKPNCLELRTVCRQDSLCRSRLADFMTNCRSIPPTVSTCPNQDNHQACLASYTRLIGTDMTPNYVDSSFSHWTISPWCTCKGSGNQEEECANFLRSFTDNTCLRNAIQAFGYGLDYMASKNASVPDPSVTAKTGSDRLAATTEPPFVTIVKYPEPRDGGPGKPQGLPEDHCACVRANVWALLPGLALALLRAQHAL
ncbi:GDNF family receptor alpha-2-like isoform X1 [Syngnathoides biaculeatus]|uniref:GDNF family receptor alpha-2-like isoform X1 n=2 Tax=Syngnathoides biaculeatus TaxID=300417 RepID=UPI002ADDFA07|nr:GDNF family receptor alpha-2-like isoform X1 [Syngnathoides biaculeatus]